MAKKEDKSIVVAASLRSHRAAKGVTQREAADKIGANVSTLGTWEQKGGMRVEDAWAAADYYGCSLDELVGRPWPPATN